ncbi:MAG: hypothetical protein WCV67_12660 [Victivallaceae bacterium]|jgi:hypothetical protein
MNIVSIKIKDGKAKFLPGEEIRGEVTWDFQKLPKKIIVNLFWFTAGQGTPDTEIVNSIELEVAGLGGRQSFQFAVPAAPYSFNGRLITLNWAVEAVAQPSGERGVCTFVMSPLDNPAVLKSIEAPLPGIFKVLSKFKPFKQMPLR